jgi:hypothetical protein
MKHASKRQQLGSKVIGRPYRVYKDQAESIHDFLLYLDAVNFPLEVDSVQEYVQELKNRSYFEAPISEYFGGVNAYHNQL